MCLQTSDTGGKERGSGEKEWEDAERGGERGEVGNGRKTSTQSLFFTTFFLPLIHLPFRHHFLRLPKSVWMRQIPFVSEVQKEKERKGIKRR